MPTRKFASASISGSQAAFSIVVRPDAVAAAMRIFPVAPTLEMSKEIVPPRSPCGARATM